MPEGEAGKSTVVLKFKDDFEIVYDTLITYDLSGIDNTAWDGEDFQPNFILLAVHEPDDVDFQHGPKCMRVPLHKDGGGYSPVYLRCITPGVQYKGYYALENLKVDANGDIIFDDYHQATCRVIADNNDQGSVLLPEGQTEITIELDTDDF